MWRLTILTLLLLLLPPLIGFVLIILGAIWAANALMNRAVGRKHRLIEEIITTGKIPPAWSGNTGLLDFSRSRMHYIRRLDSLIRYTQGSPLVGDEETREILLSRLLAVRAVWSNDHAAAEKQRLAQRRGDAEEEQ